MTAEDIDYCSLAVERLYAMPEDPAQVIADGSTTEWIDKTFTGEDTLFYEGF